MTIKLEIPMDLGLLSSRTVHVRAFCTRLITGELSIDVKCALLLHHANGNTKMIDVIDWLSDKAIDLIKIRMTSAFIAERFSGLESGIE